MTGFVSKLSAPDVSIEMTRSYFFKMEADLSYILKVYDYLFSEFLLLNFTPCPGYCLMPLDHSAILCHSLVTGHYKDGDLNPNHMGGGNLSNKTQYLVKTASVCSP